MTTQMRLKLIGCFCLMMALAPVAVFGQGRPGAGGGGGLIEQTRKILDSLDLSADQKSKIDAILEQSQSDFQKSLPDLQTMAPQDRREKMRSMMEDTKTKIEAELTPDQKDQFDKKLNDMRATLATQMISARLQQFSAALDQLELSDDQRNKANALLDDVKKQLDDAKSDNDPTSRQQKFQDAMQNMRQQLQTILTPDQLQSLRDKMQQQPRPAQAPGGITPPPPPAAGNDAPPTTQPKLATPNQPPQTMMNDASPDKAVTGAPPPKTSNAPVPDTGQSAPDFKLTTLNGSTIQLSSLKGRVIALVFGSYSCPAFRDRIAAIDQLSQSLGTRATVFLVYTKESNPVGGWEVDRNKQDNIAITQPADEPARRAMARQAISTLHLTMPTLVDDMKDTTLTAYGTFPNGAVVINRDGTIAGRQKWAEASVLKRMIDDAVAKPYHDNSK
jgi:Spy/CpxP family protein refolding chaperone